MQHARAAWYPIGWAKIERASRRELSVVLNRKYVVKMGSRLTFDITPPTILPSRIRRRSPGCEFPSWSDFRDCPDDFSALVHRDAVSASQCRVRSERDIMSTDSRARCLTLPRFLCYASRTLADEPVRSLQANHLPVEFGAPR